MPFAALAASWKELVSELLAWLAVRSLAL